MTPVIPFFQQLAGRNPRRPMSGIPLLRNTNLIPKVLPVVYEALHLRSDVAVQLYCALVYAYPRPRAEALKRGAAVYEQAADLAMPVTLISPAPDGIGAEPIKLPSQAWEPGAYQLEEEYTLVLRPTVAEWTIGNRKVIKSTWLSEATRYVEAPDGVPYRFRITGYNAIQLNPPAKLVFRTINPSKDYRALLQYLLGNTQLWGLPFSDELKQAAEIGANNPLAAPALLADLAVEAAFLR